MARTANLGGSVAQTKDEPPSFLFRQFSRVKRRLGTPSDHAAIFKLNMTGVIA